MIVTLILIGLTLFAIGFLFIVIRFFNHKPKRKFIITALVGFLLVAIGVFLTPGTETDKTKLNQKKLQSLLQPLILQILTALAILKQLQQFLFNLRQQLALQLKIHYHLLAVQAIQTLHLIQPTR
ncbi:hypothetical protein BTHER_01525 [Brochothrix thermosphacta DSM 20171 = FSL F6-1036]|nr:hypothetical protein BTHER_01525 [Brochothrix thermosphacta DSM 20171 = FSL F6-1036]